MKNKYKISELTVIEASSLIGGFSSVLFEPPQDTTAKTNNCNGGNYKSGCGKSAKKKNKATGTNSNCKGNCVKGCGDKK